MTIYNLLLVYLFVLYLFTQKRGKNKYVLFIISLLLIVIAANKDISVGSDSLNYYWGFINTDSCRNESYFTGLQVGWFYFNKLLSPLLTYGMFLTLCYSIAIGGVGYLIYKKSPNYALSFLLFYLLYFYCSSLNIMRQYIAIGIICIGYFFLSIGKKKQYIISIILGFFFHYSTVFLFPLLYIDRISRIKSFYVYLFVSITFVLGLFFSSLLDPLIRQLGFLIGTMGRDVSAYVDVFGGGRNLYTNLFINIGFVYSYYLSKNKNDMFVCLWFVFILCNNLFGAFGDGNRMFIYMQIAGMIIAMPNILGEQQNKFVRFCYCLFILCYSLGVWNISISNNLSEVVPFNFR